MPTQAEIRERAEKRLKRTKLQILRDLVEVWRKIGRSIPSPASRTLYKAIAVEHIRPKDIDMEQNEAGMLLNAQKELLTGEGSFSP